jgi:hypothetical protein
VAELADAKDLKSFGPQVRAGSSPALGTSWAIGAVWLARFLDMEEVTSSNLVLPTADTDFLLVDQLIGVYSDFFYSVGYGKN